MGASIVATFRIVVTNNRYRQDKKGVLKPRVLVAVCRLHDRSAAPEEVEIEVFEPAERAVSEEKLEVATAPFDNENGGLYDYALVGEILPGLHVRFVRIETLIRMKEAAGREGPGGCPTTQIAAGQSGRCQITSAYLPSRRSTVGMSTICRSSDISGR